MLLLGLLIITDLQRVGESGVWGQARAPHLFRPSTLRIKAAVLLPPQVFKDELP